MRLRALFHGSSLLLLGAGLAATVSLVMFAQALQNAATRMAQAVESINASERLGRNLLLNGERYFAMLTGTALRPAGHQAANAIEDSLVGIRAFIGSDLEAHLVEQVQHEIEGFNAAWREVSRLNLAPTEGYLTVSGPLERAYAPLGRLVELNLEQARADHRDVVRRNRYANWLAVGTAALLLGIVAALLIALQAYLFQPLAALASRIKGFRRTHGASSINPRWPEEMRQIARSHEEMTQALRQQQQRLQFLGGVAHDLRSPLGAAITAVDLLANPAQYCAQLFYTILWPERGSLLYNRRRCK